MQTTLLGLAVAFILALVAALVGPYFIDWNQFRPQFEAEASRVVGAPVRVRGALDARLLPAPSLRLRSVTVGTANDLGRIQADRLDVEFSLSSLMRGEWRATEVTIGGTAVDLGLNAQGRIDLPASTGPFNLGALSIDRLNVTGRIALHDAASKKTLELDDIAFSGDVRSLAAGAMRGDGNVMVAGARYPFRISSGQAADGVGTRVRLTVEPGERPLSFDADGVLNFENRTPRFDGTVTLARPVASKNKFSTKPVPWRLFAKVKADPNGARFEAVEASYGAEERALKLAGIADLRLGASPLLRAELSAKQMDVDRFVAKDSSTDEPVRPWQALHRLTEAVSPPAMATRIQISAEQIMVGARPVQNVSADLRGDLNAWSIERLEFRAPGSTRVMLSGSPTQPGTTGEFKGMISVDSSDPDTLAGWMKGRIEAGSRNQKPLRIRGNVSSATDRITIDGLTAEIDGGTVDGRVAYSYPSAAGGSRFDADLKADQLDLDAAATLIRSLGQPQTEWPAAGKLSLDIARAISTGQEMKPFVVQLAYDTGKISLDRFRIGEATGLMLDGSASYDRNAVAGRFSLNATSASLSRLSGAIAPFAPSIAEKLNATSTAGAVNAKLSLDVSGETRGERRNVRAVIDIDALQLKGTTSLTTTTTLAAIRGGDIDALSRSEVAVESRLVGQGQELLMWLGLDGLVAASQAPLNLDASATGAWRAPLRLKAKLSGADLDADIQGSAEPWATTPKATLAAVVRRANLASLFDLKTSDDLVRLASFSSRVTLNGDRIAFDDLDGTLAGSRLRGQIALKLGTEKSIDGQIGMDSLELGPALGLLLGTRGRDMTEPLGRGVLRGWRGQLSFQALSGKLPAGGDLQPVSGTIKSDGQSLSIDAIKGKIGGGELTADIDLKPSASGYALGARVQLAGVDGAALRYRSLAMPAGTTSLRMSLASAGRSGSAIEGAFSGSGLLTIDAAQISGLDPRAFDFAIRASDGGQAMNEAKLRQVVEPALSAGALSVGSVQIPFSIKDSRLRVGATTLDADGARAIVSGGYDIVADQLDLRANLAGSVAGASSIRPEIQIFATGSPDKLERTVDVAGLSSWLAVRSIDRETRRLDSLERGEQPAAPVPTAVPPPITGQPPAEPSSAKDMPISSTPFDVPVPGRDPRRAPAKAANPPRPAVPSLPAPLPPVANQQIAPLPAPIEVKPAPGARMPKARQAPPLVLTPPVANTTRPSL